MFKWVLQVDLSWTTADHNNLLHQLLLLHPDLEGWLNKEGHTLLHSSPVKEHIFFIHFILLSVLTASSTAISSKGFMLCFTPSVTTWRIGKCKHNRVFNVILPPSYRAWPWSWPHSQSLSCILQALLGPLCLKKLEVNLWKHILQVRRNGKFQRALNRSKGYFTALTFEDQKISLD